MNAFLWTGMANVTGMVGAVIAWPGEALLSISAACQHRARMSRISANRRRVESQNPAATVKVIDDTSFEITAAASQG